MAAPVAADISTRVPTGERLTDGYQSFFIFASNPTIPLWETQMTPMGYDGGDAVDTTTMYNELLRTKHPRHLIDTTDGSMTCAYDPACEDDIQDLINVNQVVTQVFPDGSTLAFWGYLRTFNRNEITEGSMPTAACTVVCTNMDDDGAEQLPVYAAPVGT